MRPARRRPSAAPSSPSSSASHLASLGCRRPAWSLLLLLLARCRLQRGVLLLLLHGSSLTASALLQVRLSRQLISGPQQLLLLLLLLLLRFCCCNFSSGGGSSSGNLQLLLPRGR